jgi:hypothetical protein
LAVYIPYNTAKNILQTSREEETAVASLRPPPLHSLLSYQRGEALNRSPCALDCNHALIAEGTAATFVPGVVQERSFDLLVICIIS